MRQHVENCNPGTSRGTMRHDILKKTPDARARILAYEHHLAEQNRFGLLDSERFHQTMLGVRRLKQSMGLVPLDDPLVK